MSLSTPFLAEVSKCSAQGFAAKAIKDRCIGEKSGSSWIVIGHQLKKTINMGLKADEERSLTIAACEVLIEGGP